MSVQVPVRHPAEEGIVLPQPQKPSLLFGPTDPPLVDLTLGELLNLQCLHHGTREGLVIPWTGARWTYNEINHHSRLLAAALLEMGIGVGDRVGIMAGNCEQYASVFFAATRIGAILVILNNTYTPTEAQYGLDFSGMRRLTTLCFSNADLPQNAKSSSPPKG
jgi:long-chain acyl-CoA synthetase